MSNKRFGCFPMVVTFILCTSLFLNLLLLIWGSRSTASSKLSFVTQTVPDLDETVVTGGSSTEKIALLPIRGVITSGAIGSAGESMVEDFKLALRQAVNDKAVKAIVLAIDSPGGEVTAADTIYQAVVKAREKKPIVIYMGSMAASGGYYIACGGSFLMASDTSITGSIGVIIETLNYQQLLGKIGVEAVVFKSGKFKDILSGSRPMTQDEKDFVQRMVMQTYDKFVGIVAKERKIPEDYLRQNIADGRIVSGRDALEQKLINGIGQIEDAYEKARQLGKAPGASVVRYEGRMKFGKLLRFFGTGSEHAQIQLNLTESFLPKLEAGKLYLLPSFYAP